MSTEISQQAQTKSDLCVTTSQIPIGSNSLQFPSTVYAALQNGWFVFQENESTSGVWEEQYKTKIILK